MISFFKDSEFVCKCGCGKNNFSKKLLKSLNLIRNQLNRKIIITSGCRCRQHNFEVGGKPNSAHLKGLAVDIYCKNNKSRAIIMEVAWSLGIRRFGIGGDFLHLDIDTKPRPRIWVY